MSTKKRVSDAFAFQPFKDLKRILREKNLSDDDLFLDAMKEVTEIREFREMPVYQKQTILANKNKSLDNETLHILEETVKGKKAINLSDTQEYVEWINQDYRENIIKKLHEGKYSVQDCLDLHGIIVEEAATELERFFRESLRKRYQCIKIIHGRGLRSTNGPVLKKAVIQWLLSRYRKHIVAFVTARQCDGGLGALYILLQ